MSNMTGFLPTRHRRGPREDDTYNLRDLFILDDWCSEAFHVWYKRCEIHHVWWHARLELAASDKYHHGSDSIFRDTSQFRECLGVLVVLAERILEGVLSLVEYLSL